MRKFLLIISFFALYILNIVGQDFSYDKEVGKEGAKEVEATMGIYNDSVLADYISGIGNRLVNVIDNSPVNFKFHLVDSPDPNAFALPGGYIYITRGLLTLINDESELADVIGHEMIHVTKRHSVKQMKKGILPGILQIPGAIIGIASPGLGNLINTPINFGSQVYLSSYSRGQEKEADQYGIKLASKAGYDPNMLAHFLHRLSLEVERITGEEEKKSYLASHPYTPKRQAFLEKEIETLQWNPKKAIAPTNEDVYKKLEGMVFGQNPQQGIIKDNIFMHPDLDLAVTFPDKWLTVNIPVAVGAAQEEGKAQIVIEIENTSKDSDSLGMDFVAQIKKNGINPKNNKSITINGNKAYYVSLLDVSSAKPVEAQIYWIEINDFVLQVSGICYIDYSNAITKTAKSVRNLTTKEKSGISSLKLHIAHAKEGESLDELSLRTNNKWDKQTTMIMNDLETDLKLGSGQVLKIVVEEPYLGKN